MDAIILKIMELVISIVVALIGYYVVPFIKAKIATEKTYEVAHYVMEFVQAAEQIYGEKTGKTKKDYVVDLVTKLCDETHLNLTHEQIVALVESAVYDLKNLQIHTDVLTK